MRAYILIFLFLFFFQSNVGWTEESAEEWFKKGIESIEAEKYKYAIFYFKKTIDLHPEHVPSYSNLGYLYNIAGMQDEAIDVYKKALAINPNDVRLHHDLGFTWYKKKMFDEAIEALKKAISMDSGFAPSYQTLGVVYIEKKMFDEAIEALKKAISMDSGFAPSYQTLGVVYIEKKMFGQAVPVFKKALEISPGCPVTHCNLGKAYKELGKKVLGADHYYQGAVLYLKEGNREEALKAYENILQCSMQIADILLKRLYPFEEVNASPLPLHSKKKDQWYVLLTRMNIRTNYTPNSQIIGRLDKDTKFKIIQEAPNNTPFNSWFLIRSKSGVNGWLCGVHKGIVNYDSVSELSE